MASQSDEVIGTLARHALMANKENKEEENAYTKRKQRSSQHLRGGI